MKKLVLFLRMSVALFSKISVNLLVSSKSSLNLGVKVGGLGNLFQGKDVPVAKWG